MFLKHFKSGADEVEAQDLWLLKVDSIRNPFRIKKLPLMARFCKVWFDNQVHPKKRLKAKLFRGIYVKLTRLGLNPQGVFEIDLRGQKTDVSFRVRNTQYTSIFLDRFAEGCEAEVSTLIETLLPQNGVFYDIGSNFGYFSLFTASNAGFSGKIFSFEPNPESFSDLKKHVDELGLANTITPNCMGLFEKDGFIHVKPSGVRSGNFALGDQTETEDGAYKVKLQRLDDLGFAEPDMMKIDTEGSELGVLKGAEKTLAASKPYIILETAHDKADPAKTLGPLLFLQEKDYLLYHVGWAKKSGETLSIHDEEEVSTGERKILCLSRLVPEQRFLFAERLNILAVHKDRLPDLGAKFTNQSLFIKEV